jgi:hypothetical protein
MVQPMRYLLLALAVPVGIGAYLLTAQLIVASGIAGGMGDLLVIFLPLFVAGLAVIPFIAPFVDYKAKQALANAPGRDGAANQPVGNPPAGNASAGSPPAGERADTASRPGDRGR